MSQQVVLSAGLGVDSTAVLVRWLTDPSSRDFPLSALTVLIAQVGDEYPDTYTSFERMVLPMLAARRVRTVQVARPALTTSGGKRYVVLDDSAMPSRLVRSGPVRLSDELAASGTVAQVSNRRCSLRWKGEVLDAWIADHIAPGFTHVLGYEAGEGRRIARDAGIDRHRRRPDYPLRRWGWDRATSTAFLYTATGSRFDRSCCAHCPFQTSLAGRTGWATRWAAHPDSAGLALRLEYTALALNPRMALFGARTGWDLAAEHGLTGALNAARRQLAVGQWAVYEVRRTYTGASAAMRSVRVLARGTRSAMQTTLAGMHPGRVEVDGYGIQRVWLRLPAAGFPRTEHLLVAAPAGVVAKQRPGFEHVWHELTDASATTAAIDESMSLCGGG